MLQGRRLSAHTEASRTQKIWGAYIGDRFQGAISRDADCACSRLLLDPAAWAKERSMSVELNGVAHIQLTVIDPKGIPFWETLCHFLGMETLIKGDDIVYCIGSRTGI